MKIGILSDTHGTLDPQFVKIAATCDYLIHAGDIGTEKCYQALKDIAVPLYAVRGNCDNGSWAAYLPETLAFRIDGLTFYLIHNLNNLPFHTDDSDIYIFGHTHQHTIYKKRGCTYINPGSAGRGRGISSASIAILTTGKDEPLCEFISLEQ